MLQASSGYTRSTTAKHLTMHYSLTLPQSEDDSQENRVGIMWPSCSPLPDFPSNPTFGGSGVLLLFRKVTLLQF